MAYVCSNCGSSAESAGSGICPFCRNGVLSAALAPQKRVIAAAAADPAAPAGGPAPGPAPAGGGRPPTGSSLSATSAPTASSLTGGLLGRVVAAAVGVAALIWAYQAVPGWWDRHRHPSEPAAGVFESQTLGVRLSLPAGYRHLRKDDSVETMGPDMVTGGMPLSPAQRQALGQFTVRLAMFFRGSRSQNPDRALVVGAVDLSSPLMRQVVAQNFDDVAKSAVKFMGRRQPVTVSACAPAQFGAAKAISCTGTAEVDGDTRPLCVYAWQTGAGLGLGLMFARSAPPCDELEAIVRSMTPL